MNVISVASISGRIEYSIGMAHFITLLFAACQTEHAEERSPENQPSADHAQAELDQAENATIASPTDLLMSALELHQHPEYSAIQDRPSPVEHSTIVLDTRPEKHYLEGHIPGAINLNVDLTWNTDFTLIPIAEMEQLLGQKGLSQDHAIVIYDDGSFKNTARMYWILESHGHEDLHVLNGGIKSWLANELPLSTEPTEYQATQFTAKVRPEHIATKLTVRQAIDDNRVALIDSRPEAEFKGLVSPLGRSGKIPSSINVEWSNITSDNGSYKSLKTPAELKDVFKDIPEGTEQVIAYCNKGKQSAVTYLGLKTMGYTVAAYDGSWYEWSKDPSLPVE